MNTHEHNERVEQTLEALEGIRPAEARPFLYTRIMERLQGRAATLMRPQKLWQLALSLTLVAGINIWGGITYWNQHRSPASSGNGAQQVVAEYFGSGTNYGL